MYTEGNFWDIVYVHVTVNANLHVTEKLILRNLVIETFAMSKHQVI